MASAATEVAAVESALSTLLTSTTTGNARAREARTLSRAADDLEVAAAECADAATRHALMEQVNAARAAAVEARLAARVTAQAEQRLELFEDVAVAKDEGQAASLARDINEGLRRATAVVAEEVERSRAAGKVVDESGRRLRMTRDQHGRYSDMLRSGSATLGELKRSERAANVAVIASLVLFFFVAASVAQRRMTSSNTATFFVRPVAKIAFAPLRIMSGILGLILEKPVLDPPGGKESKGTAQEVKRKERTKEENSSGEVTDEWTSAGTDQHTARGNERHVRGVDEAGGGSSDDSVTAAGEIASTRAVEDSATYATKDIDGTSVANEESKDGPSDVLEAESSHKGHGTARGDGEGTAEVLNEPVQNKNEEDVNESKHSKHYDL